MNTQTGYFKKALVVLMAVMMMFTMMPAAAWADESAGPQGTGTEADPYQITSADELMWFAGQVNGSGTKSTSTLCAVLKNNIDLTGKAWTPIGIYNSYSDYVYYGGIFDGGGFTVSGLSIDNGKQYQAFIGYVKGGTVKNLTVSGEVTTSTNSYAYAAGIVAYGSPVTMENCVNRVNVTATAKGYIGGVIGYSNTGSSIKNCRNVGNVSGTGDYTGGIVGTASGTTTITNCLNSGEIRNAGKPGSYSYCTGGIAGNAGSASVISMCGNTGDISSTIKRTGGIVGSLDGTVEKSFNTGSITGIYGVGGIAGDSSGSKGSTITACYNKGNICSVSPTAEFNDTNAKGVGGVLGGVSSNSAKAKVSDCYNTGSVTSSSAIKDITLGGVIGNSSGKNYKGDVTENLATAQNSYYLTDSAAQGDGYSASAAGIASRNADQMKASDFAAALGDAFISVADDYPMLGWQDPNAQYTVTFSVEPAGAVLTVKDSENNIVNPQEAGSTVFKLKNGTYTYEVTGDECAPSSGTFTVAYSGLTIPISLKVRKYDFVLSTVPENADLTVTGQVPLADGRTYQLPKAGNPYSYSADAFGYDKLEGTFSVTGNTESDRLNVVLTKQKTYNVVIPFEKEDGGMESETTIAVNSKEYPSAVIAAETDGSFRLPDGNYAYKVSSPGYKSVSGEFTVSEASVQVPKAQLLIQTSWDGTTYTEPVKDSEGFYLIYTADELMWFNSNGKMSDSVKLMADIRINEDVSDQAETRYRWNPIGNRSSKYTGIFDGNGYTLSGLYIDSTAENTGLIGYTDTGASVKNLTIDDSCIFSKNKYVGTFIGDSKNAVIDNCHTTEAVQVSGAQYAGGIVGELDGGCTVTHCSNRAEVTSAGTYVGGIAGRIYSNSSNALADSFNAGNVTGLSFVGGITGSLYNGGTIQNVYNTGNIRATNEESGLAGGLTGQLRYGAVSNAYTTGSIHAAVKGAVAGNLDFPNGMKSLSSVYYLETTADDIVGNLASCTIQSGTAEGKTAEALQGIAEALGDAFAEDVNSSNNGYPILAWQAGNVEDPDAPAIDPDGWNGKASASAPVQKDGVYQIGTAAELKWFANKVKTAPDLKGALTADIDLNNQPWTPVGGTSAETGFAGSFDGNDFTIKNLYIKGGSQTGIFAYNCGEIKNLTVEGLIIGADLSGGLVGTNLGRIENISSSVTVKGGNKVAGIAGINESGGIIKNCSNKGTVSGGQYVAGIAAYNCGEISGCTNQALITAESTFVAGIAADNDTAVSAKGNVTNCANSGHIIGKAANRLAYVGGIVGRNNSTASYLYNSGNIVSRGSSVGGCIGITTSGAAANNLYSTGDVCGAYQETEAGEEFRVGGAIGEMRSGVTDAYYLETLPVAQSGSNGGTPVSGEVLQKKAGDLAGMLAQKPQIAGIVSIPQTPEVGEEVSASYEAGNSTSPIYVWYFDWGGEEEVLSVSYRFMVPSDFAGKKISVKVMDSDLSGILTAESEKADGFTGNVRITGIPVIGHTVTASYSGTQEVTGYQWYRGNTAITGATSEAYTVQNDDLGKVLSVRVTGLKPGYAEAKTEIVKTGEAAGIWPAAECEEPANVGGTYVITKEAELKWFVNAVNSGKTTASGKLANDITISGKKWYPIGTNEKPYAGTFDGNEKTVSYELEAGNKGTQGLFGNIAGSGTVKNLTVNCTVTAAGSDALEIGGIAGTVEGKILNCIVKGTVSGDSHVGGLVGSIGLHGKAANCRNEATVNGRESVGGIAGISSYGDIYYCSNKGSITAEGIYAGGIAGNIQNYAVINASYNTAAVTGSKYVGGISGQVYVAAAPQGCYNTGALDGGVYTGAVLGQIDGTDYITLVTGSFYARGLPTDKTAQAVEPDAMKKDAFVRMLNGQAYEECYEADSHNINGGLPVLKWENGTQQGETEPEEPVIKDRIQVSFTLIGDTRHGSENHTDGDYVWISRTTLKGLPADTTAYDVFQRVLGEKGYTYDITGNGYVKSITTPAGLKLGELDNGPYSGWMYTINSVFPDYMDSVTLKDGDDMVFFFVDDYRNTGWNPNGKPGESTYNPADPEENTAVSTTGTSGSAATTAPTEVTVSGSTATATVKSENASEAIKQAKENKSAEIVLNVAASDTKGVETVKVQLDTATVKSVVFDTSASLTVKTENGQVSLDREALTTVVSEAKGTTITLEVIKVINPTEVQKKAAGTNGQVLQLVVKSGDKIISDFNKGKATVTVEIPTKLQDKKVAAIYIAEDGKIEQLSGKTVKIGGKDYYTFETPHFSTFALVDAEELGLEVNDEEANIVKIKELVSDMSLKASSSKTSKKNIKVTLTVDKSTAAAIKEIKNMGYTVKYKYYRSTKKASKYQAKITKTTKTFTNTAGKKGTRYYYKARIQVCDKDGKLVAQTALKQCKYAVRTWTK